MFQRAEVTIMLHDPDGNLLVHKIIPIENREWAKNGLDPLPKGHDSPFDLDSQRVAQEMIKKRSVYLERLSFLVHQFLSEGIQAQDTIRGYGKE